MGYEEIASHIVVGVIKKVSGSNLMSKFSLLKIFIKLHNDAV